MQSCAVQLAQGASRGILVMIDADADRYDRAQVCALCQHASDGWVEPFKDWAKNCGDARKADFPKSPPAGTSIPAWASKGDIDGEWSIDPLKAAATPSSAPSSSPNSSSTSAVRESPSSTANSPTTFAAGATLTPSSASHQSGNEQSSNDRQSPSPTPPFPPAPGTTSDPTASAVATEHFTSPSTSSPITSGTHTPDSFSAGSHTEGTSSDLSESSTFSQDSDSLAEADRGSVYTDQPSGMSLTLPGVALAAQTDRSSGGRAIPGSASSINALDEAEYIQTGVKQTGLENTDIPPTAFAQGNDVNSTIPPSSPTLSRVESKLRNSDTSSQQTSTTSLAGEHEQLMASADPFSGVKATATEIDALEAEKAGRVKIGIICGSLAGSFVLVFLIFRFWTCSQYRKTLRETIDPEIFEKVRSYFLPQERRLTIERVLDKPSFWQKMRSSVMPNGPAPVAGAIYAAPAAAAWRSIRSSIAGLRKQPEEVVPPVPSLPTEYGQQVLAPRPPPKSLAALRNIPRALQPGSRRGSEEDTEETTAKQRQPGAGYGYRPGPRSIPTIGIENISSPPPNGQLAPLYDEREGERASWI